MSIYAKNNNNNSGVATDFNVSGNITTTNVTTNNLTASGNISFPAGSINANCINGLLSELEDTYLYALLNSGSSTQTFLGSQAFQNSLNLQGAVTFSSGSSINFSNTTVSNLSQSSVGLSNVNNTSDTNKPVSTAQQTALNLKSNIASPTFTGTLTSPSISTNALSLNGIDLFTTLSNLAPLLNPSFSGTLTLSKFGIISNTSNFWLYNNANSADVNYALFQNNSGATIINSSTGQSISLNINNVNYASLSTSAFTILNTLITPSITLNGTSLSSSLALLAPLASPSFSGILSTPAITLNGTSLSSTLALLAPKASPTFTGTVIIPVMTFNGSDLTTTLNNKQAILNSTLSNSISCLSLSTPTISLNSVDLGTTLTNKQAILNSTSSNAISCLSLSTPTISLNSVDLGTTLSNKQATITTSTNLSINTLTCTSLSAQKASIVSDNSSMWLYNNTNGYGVNFALYQSSSGNTVLNSSSGQTLDFKINNSTSMSVSSNGVTLNNGLTINQVSQSGIAYGSGITFSYANPSTSLSIFPGYLGTYFCGGAAFTSSGLPVMSNQMISVMWTTPLSCYGTSNDSYMNTVFIEVSYWIQECATNTTSSTFPIFSFIPSPGNPLGPLYSSQSSTTSNNTTNLNIGNLFCCGTGIFYIANSASGTLSTSTSIKYISGSFSGGGGSLTSSTNRYGTTFTPVTFARTTINRINIYFNYPAYNNTPTTNTYSTGQYITNYGCSCRIIGSDPANGSSSGNIYPSTQTTQAFNSFSQIGRAYLSY